MFELRIILHRPFRIKPSEAVLAFGIVSTASLDIATHCALWKIFIIFIRKITYSSQWANHAFMVFLSFLYLDFASLTQFSFFQWEWTWNFWIAFDFVAAFALSRIEWKNFPIFIDKQNSFFWTIFDNLNIFLWIHD